MSRSQYRDAILDVLRGISKCDDIDDLYSYIEIACSEVEDNINVIESAVHDIENLANEIALKLY